MVNSFFFQEYLFIFIFFIVSIILSILIFSLSYFLVINLPDAEKLSPYECGFDPYEDARQTFDVKFYLISILFLIFDLETMYLFPWVVSLNQISLTGFWIMIDFFVELIVGFVYVWKTNSLDW
jgi:NADH-quinone oxidoreductase subunit A